LRLGEVKCEIAANLIARVLMRPCVRADARAGRVGTIPFSAADSCSRPGPGSADSIRDRWTSAPTRTEARLRC
jgi:hypothetical protein